MKNTNLLCALILSLTASLAWGQNDMVLSDASYGSFAYGDSEDWADVEYSFYPVAQLRPLNASARVKNMGSSAVSGVFLEVILSDTSGWESSYQSAAIEIAMGDSAVLEVGSFIPPANEGEYELRFVVHPENDDNPDNNSLVRTFSVSQSEFARDRSAFEGGYTETGSGEFKAGPGYHFTNSAEIHCMGVALSDLSELGAEYNIHLVVDMFEISQDPEVVAETLPQVVDASMLNASGLNEGIFTWNFLADGPYYVEENSELVAMFNYDGDGPQPIIGYSGESTSQSNFVYIGEEWTYYFSNDTYMVRLGLSESFCVSQVLGLTEYVTVSGTTYHDANCNEQKDPGENVINHRMIYSDEGFPHAFSNVEGQYSFFAAVGEEHLLEAEPLEGFVTNTNTVYADESSEIYDVDFGYCVEEAVADFGISVTPIGLPPRPGFPVAYEICVSNNGTMDTGLNVSFDFSNMLNATVIEADGGNVVGSVINWELGQLGLFQSHCFQVVMQVPQGTPIGVVYKPSAMVEPASQTIDVNMDDNHHTFTHEVVAAYDPNDKTVDYPVVNYTELEPGEGTELEYLIRFQNTGNFFATDVRVEDELPELLDISTIEMIHASHDFELLFHDEHNIEWVFEDIMLPDSTSDEPGSHGHIHFRIKTVPEVSLEDVIGNSASILFDFKDPVVTEPAVTSFVDCSEGSLSIEAPEVLCLGELSVFTSNRPEFDEYVWSINDQEIIGEEIEYTSFTEELVNVELTVSNAVCTLSTEMQLPVIPQPSFSVIPEGFTLCSLDQELDINAVGSVSWFLDDELVATGDPVVLSESGNYYVVAENECGSFEINVPVQIVDTPDEVSITYDGEQLTVEPEGSDYVWLLNGLPIITEGPTLVPTESGEYSVVVYFEGSSCSLSSNVLLVTVSVDDLLAAQTAIFPNPAEDMVTVLLPQGVWKVRLVDATGRKLRSIENVTASQFDMDLKGIAPGAYFIRIDSNRGSVVKKLIVK